jgi:hypothetical protein
MKPEGEKRSGLSSQLKNGNKEKHRWRRQPDG